MKKLFLLSLLGLFLKIDVVCSGVVILDVNSNSQNVLVRGCLVPKNATGAVSENKLEKYLNNFIQEVNGDFISTISIKTVDGKHFCGILQTERKQHGLPYREFFDVNSEYMVMHPQHPKCKKVEIILSNYSFDWNLEVMREKFLGYYSYNEKIKKEGI